MSRTKRRADRVRGEISILEVLASYGYTVQPGGGDREQQFSCDLHGDGRDDKPSARAYPSTHQWYCWACATSRDAIQTVREKENLDFFEALNALERRYNLPPLPWSEEDDEDDRGEKPAEAESQVHSAEEAQRRVAALLKAVTMERTLPLDRILQLWEDQDKLSILLRNPPEDLLDRFLELRDRMIRLTDRA